MSMRLLLALLALAACTFASAKPHIIIFLVDDLGWYNVGFHNHDLETPEMNKLHASGVELRRHYAYTVCSPSRSALMSGRLPIHVNEGNPVNITDIGGVDIRMTMLPMKLKEAGYATAMVGKWHLGARQWANLPRQRGFDKFFGFLTGGEDHFTQVSYEANSAKDLWRDDDPAYGETGKYSCDLYTDEAVKVIKEHDNSIPLFYYISMQSTHAPYQCPEEYQDNTINYKDRRIMDCMVRCVDGATGKVTQALKDNSMWENTFMLWSSDNGGPQYKSGNNHPLRGGKGTFFEGGVRVASFIVGGAVTAQPGSQINQLIHFADWYATFCKMAEIDPADDIAGLPSIDSLDQTSVLKNPYAPPVRTEVVLSQSTIIVGDMKFVKSTSMVGGECHGQGCGYWTPPLWPHDDNRTPTRNDPGCQESGCLFNLTADPLEEEDLAEKQPYQLKLLKWKLQKAKDTKYQTNFMKESQSHCVELEDFIAKHSGFAGPVCQKGPPEVVALSQIRRLRG